VHGFLLMFIPLGRILPCADELCCPTASVLGPCDVILERLPDHATRAELIPPEVCSLRTPLFRAKRTRMRCRLDGRASSRRETLLG
jgi:hypothetical protein